MRDRKSHLFFPPPAYNYFMLDSSKDKILDLINQSGFPFQHHCAKRIKSIGKFEVAQEVPYTYPGSNGPLLGVHGTIDILATARDAQETENIICFVVEAKKANKELKKWFFFENQEKNPRWPAFVFELENSKGGRSTAVTRTLTLPDVDYVSPASYQFCSNALETNEQLSAINKSQQEKVYNSLKQAAHASRAFMNMPKAIEGLKDLTKGSYKNLIFLPVVVTNADLFIPKFSRKALLDGEIKPKNFDLGESLKWLTYDFPLPDYSSYSFTRPDGKSILMEKLTVFIVNINSLEEFFDNARNIQTINGIPPSW